MCKELASKCKQIEPIENKPSEEDIESMEKTLKTKFGNEYKEFLKEFGNLSVDYLEFYGYTKDNDSIPSSIYATKNAKEDYKNFPGDLVVFYDVGDGSFYAVDSNDCIHFCQYGKCKKENLKFKDFLFKETNELIGIDNES